MRSRRQRTGQRGVIIVLAGVGLVIALAFIGLFTDLGLAYVTKARLAKAVDAGALAAARNTTLGNSAMQTLAQQVASSNYPGAAGKYAVTIDTQSIDTTKVTMSVAAETPTFFFRLLGPKTVSMKAFGEATRFPLDLSLVLDVSLSLQMSGSFPDLQAAAKTFIARFDPNIDQVGLVTFSTAAKENVKIAKSFITPIDNAIDGLSPIAFTNIDDGLKFGATQVASAPKRANAIKIIVLFTDGRPTGFHDKLDVKNPPGKYDGVVTTLSDGSFVTGLWEPVNGQRVNSFDGSGKPVLGSTSVFGVSQDLPTKLPNGQAATAANVLAMAYAQSEQSANDARAAGYRIYCIGLGNLDATDPADTPDLDLLKRIANENGIVDKNQPRGNMVFAPSSATLTAVFAQVADRILTRLTR